MQEFEEKTIDSKEIFNGRIIRVSVDTVQLPNGEQSTREIVKHPGAVGIIPVTPDGKLVLVEQYRKALEKTIIEIPAGKIEPGEDPAICALRELEEETGYGVEKLTYLQPVVTAPGFCDEIVHLYAAENLFKLEHPKAADEDEFVEVLEVTIEEAETLMAKGAICDAKTIIAVMWLKSRLQK